MSEQKEHEKPVSETKSWLGSSMQDIYGKLGPWGYETPAVSPSRHHAVLYELPVTLNCPPKPHTNTVAHHWDDDHVRMPYSEKNLFPKNTEDEVEQPTIVQRWEVIQTALLQPIRTSAELEDLISSYNTRLPKFAALHYFFEEAVQEEETQYFFNTLLPDIIGLALQLPEIVPGNLPLLKQGHSRCISLSQWQIASILANAFLCTFPWRKDISPTYPGINFSRLFAAHWRPKRIHCIAEKLKCIFNYFRRVLETKPLGVVTFERKHLGHSGIPRWDLEAGNLGGTKVRVCSAGKIEDDGLGLLQVDFANKNVGGGVLGYGCVQEEIRYIICPELIVSRLFTEQLNSNEALVVTGVERYSNYTGYGDGFEWNGDCRDKTPLDSYGRRRTTIVAIDATRFNKPADQYSGSLMLREVTKAYIGFHSHSDCQLAAVATGNWGCGAFKGSPRLKFLIQLMACRAAKRDMVYYTFGDEELRQCLHEMHSFLATNQITISQLWKYLSNFKPSRASADDLYPFIYKAHLSTKSQPTIKSEFSLKRCEKKTSLPSVLSSKSDTGNKTDKSELEEVENADDIMESMKFIFKKKVSNKCMDKDVSKHNKVIQLIDIIDGTVADKDEAVEGPSLLCAIDKYSELNKCNNSKNGNVEGKGEEAMDVDRDVRIDIEDVNVTSVASCSSTHKRKITDYFSKIE